jgi:hypothetical protein
VRYSIARRLGMDVGGRRTSDRHVEASLTDAGRDAALRSALAADRLFQWHASSRFLRVAAAPVRSGRAPGAMTAQVRTGCLRPIGRERVYFEAQLPRGSAGR